MNILTIDNKQLIGFNIYYFIRYYQKQIGYDIDKEEDGLLFIYDQFFPSQILSVYLLKYKDENVHSYIRKRINLLFELSKNKLHITKKIYFFYTFTFYSKYDYDFNILKFIKEEIENKFKKEVVFILNNHAKDDDYVHFNSYKYDIYNNARKQEKQKNEHKKEKTFICLNAKVRHHRDDIYNFILKNNILNDFYFTYLEHDHKINLWQTENLNNFGNKYLANDYSSAHLAFEFYLNDDLFNTKHGFFFDKSYYYIVTETSALDNLCFMGEKTYKAFYHKIPFIILGNPYSLKNLKKEGFKTFDKWIDESYDIENDYEKRKKIIFNEILRLNNLSKNEHEKNLIEMNDILEHNYKHFMNTENIKNDFLKLLK